MPKLIDYPRTSYTGAWEVAEVVDDTGGKCTLETCARKLNRKVSGSFKAIVGSAVKFGLLTSKREVLTTTTLFRRIKHAYDKQEELLFHREAFLTPPLFTQLCRKFRSRELPVAMLDVLLIREFGVEEINAQGVSKAFVDGARMVGLLNEHNTLADIDQLAAKQPARRELASPPPAANVFRQAPTPLVPEQDADDNLEDGELDNDHADDHSAAAPAAVTGGRTSSGMPLPTPRTAPQATSDAIASLFNLGGSSPLPPVAQSTAIQPAPTPGINIPTPLTAPPTAGSNTIQALFQLQLTGPGINTTLEVVDADDLLLVRALLDKIERQLKRG